MKYTLLNNSIKSFDSGIGDSNVVGERPKSQFKTIF